MSNSHDWVRRLMAKPGCSIRALDKTHSWVEFGSTSEFFQDHQICTVCDCIRYELHERTGFQYKGMDEGGFRNYVLSCEDEQIKASLDE